MYNRSFGASTWQTMLAWGRNAASTGDTTDSYLLESAVAFSKTHTVFGRFERADKNELFPQGSPLADETFGAGKLSLGYIYDFLADGISSSASADWSANTPCRANWKPSTDPTRRRTCCSLA